MHLFDYTASTAEANLAIDEALLLNLPNAEALRFWEMPDPLVVMGRSTRCGDEVNVAACRRIGAVILRRISGGASIVTGNGCLMYAVVLDVAKRPELAGVGAAHRYVLRRLVEAITPLEPTVRVAGTSDLALVRDGALKKCSGNSMRLARGRLLYHGTLLYSFDCSLISNLLLAAPRQPTYRGGRDHEGFVANLDVRREDLKRRLAESWFAEPTTLPDSVRNASDRLAEERYQRRDWNTIR